MSLQVAAQDSVSFGLDLGGWWLWWPQGAHGIPGATKTPKVPEEAQLRKPCSPEPQSPEPTLGGRRTLSDSRFYTRIKR